MREVRGTVVLETLDEVADPKHTAFLVIDLQNDTCSPKGLLASRGRDISAVRNIIPNVKAALDEARRANVMVIFMRSLRSRDGSCEPGPRHRLWDKFGAFPDGDTITLLEGTWGSEVLENLAPRPDERQITKYQSDAFLGTPLDLILRNRGIKSVVVVGVGTWGCVESTVRTLNYLGYYPVVLTDGVSDPKRDLHEASLRLMSVTFADVVTTNQLLDVWRSSSTPHVPHASPRARVELE